MQCLLSSPDLLLRMHDGRVGTFAILLSASAPTIYSLAVSVHGVSKLFSGNDWVVINPWVSNHFVHSSYFPKLFQFITFYLQCPVVYSFHFLGEVCCLASSVGGGRERRPLPTYKPKASLARVRARRGDHKLAHATNVSPQGEEKSR